VKLFLMTLLIAATTTALARNRGTIIENGGGGVAEGSAKASLLDDLHRIPPQTAAQIPGLSRAVAFVQSLKVGDNVKVDFLGKLYPSAQHPYRRVEGDLAARSAAVLIADGDRHPRENVVPMVINLSSLGLQGFFLMPDFYQQTSENAQAAALFAAAIHSGITTLNFTEESYLILQYLDHPDDAEAAQNFYRQLLPSQP
jgi:hypothetical protein